MEVVVVVLMMEVVVEIVVVVVVLVMALVVVIVVRFTNYVSGQIVGGELENADIGCQRGEEGSGIAHIG